MVSGKLSIGGLSPSAAVTKAYLMSLYDVKRIEFTQYDIIKYSHLVEIEIIGLKKGILDQSANVLSLNNQLMIMDYQNWKHEMISKGNDIPEFEVEVVYLDFTKNLIGTDFNNRFDEFRVAGWMLQEIEGLDLPKLHDVVLRDIPRDVYEKNKDQLLEQVRKGAGHFYTEQDRVEKGAEAW